MAIGDGGENVGLAGELTGFDIKVEGKGEEKKVKEDSDHKSE